MVCVDEFEQLALGQHERCYDRLGIEAGDFERQKNFANADALAQWIGSAKQPMAVYRYVLNRRNSAIANRDCACCQATLIA